MLSSMGSVLNGLVRVLVVDDHPVVRDGVETLTRACELIRIVGYASTGKGALDIVEDARPHVVLLDLRLPDVVAPELVRELNRRAKGVKIILFTAYPDHPAVDAALAAGAYGVLPKDASRMDLVDAITRAVHPEEAEGKRGDGQPRRATHSLMARREYDVLRRVATGETNQQIADELGLSLNTIKTYLRNLMAKLGARNRVEAISRARDMGLL
jgi:two-component system, NarL family, nitrate/nitrite response regulator NarL